eukprot:gene3397-biopygen3353
MRELFPTVTAFAITDQAGSEHNEHSESVAPEEPDAGHPPASRLETLVTQQIAMMQMMMAQMKDLNKRVEIVEDAAAKAMTQGSEAAQSGDTELEALKKLLYVPHVAGHPFPARLGTLETEMPQLYDLHNDKTYDGLSKRTNSSMRYEQSVLAPALSYMHDSIAYAGVNSEVMRRFSCGAGMRLLDKAPLPFYHGVSLRDAAPQQLEWMAGEIERCLRTGAWDGHHAVGIHPEYQEYVQFDRIDGKYGSWKAEVRSCGAGQFADELADVSYYPHGVGGYKTVPSFLWELTDKVVRLYGDNRAVVAMLFHFTSRNPELIRRMRRLWILLDLNDIELQARHQKRGQQMGRTPLQGQRPGRLAAEPVVVHVEHLDMSKERYKVLDKGPQVVAVAPCLGGHRPVVYIAHLLAKGTMQAASMQPYVSATNNYYEDIRFRGPAKGRGVSRAVKGMASMQVQAAAAAAAAAVRVEQTVVFALVTFGRPDTGVSMLRKHISIADGTVSVVLHKEKGRQHVSLKRLLIIPVDGVRGLV